VVIYMAHMHIARPTVIFSPEKVTEV
jgi:hypothetical protein